jgi:cell filamentation protein
VPQDPYSDPVTGVLYNKLGLRSAAALEAAEREIHKRIFGDVYQWAGQIRTVAIARSAMFCRPQYIDSAAAVIFRELHDEDCLRGLRRDAFVGRLAYHLGEVNALHPFREGSGRAQRAFFAQLARSTGFTLAWQHLDPVRNVEASAAIMRGDSEPMRARCSAHSSWTAPDHARSAIRRGHDARCGGEFFSVRADPSPARGLLCPKAPPWPPTAGLPPPDSRTMGSGRARAVTFRTHHEGYGSRRVLRLAPKPLPRQAS